MTSSRVIDFHCHIAAEMCFPPRFLDGVVDNILLALASRGVPATREKVAKMHARTLDDPLCDELVAEMDEAGIDEAVLLLPDFTYALPGGSHTIEQLIDHHRMVRDRHPGRFRVFLGVDPQWGPDAVDLFERAIRVDHFDGMKIYPPCGYSPSDRALYPMYEICAELSLPVLTHLGATSPALDFTQAHPLAVDQAARDFPGVDFVLAHGSLHHPSDAAMLCNNRPNVYLDVSGYQSADAGSLSRLFERGINHKIIFGTDWPIFRLQGRQAALLERLTGDDAFTALSAGDQDLVLRDNAARLLARGDRSPVAAEGSRLVPETTGARP